MKNSFFFLARVSWRNAHHHRRRIILVYTLLFISNLSVLFIPFLYGWFINLLQKDGVHAIRFASLYVIIYLGLFGLQYCCLGPARVMERKLAFAISKNFFEYNFVQVLHLPIEWHKNNHTGSIINRFNKANIALRDYIQTGSVYFRTIMQFVFSLVSIIYLSPLFGSIAAITGILTIYLIFQFDKPYIKSLAQLNEDEHRITASLSDNLRNIFTIKVLRLDQEMRQDLMGKVDKMFSSFRRNILISEKKWFFANLLVVLIYCISIFGYVYMNSSADEVFYVGSLVTLIGLVNQFTDIFYNIAIQYNQMVRYSTDVKSVRDIEESYQRTYRIVDDELLPRDWRNIEINNLRFYYGNNDNGNSIKDNSDGHEHLVLDNLRLHVKKGDKIALTGASGMGKSTLLAVLKGLYWPEDDIELKVEGKEQNWETLTNSVTLLPQSPEIFEQSIRYNISLGLPYTDEEIFAACRIAKFDDVVNNLPSGLDTLVRESGVNLSVGQKQRLTLARGVLAAKKSTIVLLDEPTSNVDEQTEEEIYKNLLEEFHDKLVICSIHHLKLLKYFDFMYALDKSVMKVYDLRKDPVAEE
jgi:ATP-binding cassette, subfamily B, bacterial